MDRFRAFEVFATVVAKGSFVQAARALSTSPANVTRYISELEAHLDTRLLNRTSRKFSLTDSGAALYGRCRSILDDVAETEAIVSSAALQPRGRLRVNAPLSFGVLQLAPLWPRFAAKYPDVDLDISLIDRVVDIVEEGYDLAVRISRTGSTAHIARKLAASKNIVCASPDYLKRHGAPATPAELGQHACIGYSHAATATDWHLFDDSHHEHVARVSYAMVSNNGDTARIAALAGMGIIWQPTFLVGADLRAGRLVEIMPGYRMQDIDILAIYPSRRHLSAKVRVMVDFLVESFAGTPPWDRVIDSSTG